MSNNSYRDSSGEFKKMLQREQFLKYTIFKTVAIQATVDCKERIGAMLAIILTKAVGRYRKKNKLLQREQFKKYTIWKCTTTRVIEINRPKQLPNVVYTIFRFHNSGIVNHTSIDGTEMGTFIVIPCTCLTNSRQTAPECKWRGA